MPKLREIIARNVQALIDAQADANGSLTTSRAIAKAAGVSHSTVQRVVGQRPEAKWPSLDNIDRVARAFGFSAYQLLIEDFDPADPPLVMSPAVRRELRELRLMRRSLEALAQHGTPTESNPGTRGIGAGDDGADSVEAGGPSSRGRRR
jgi:transcriptional regulator with XRE-family HTH domain